MTSLSIAVASAKSPEAFRTISEAAIELDVPQHVLRFWETRFSQIRPIKRAGGRRYYRPEDIELLRGIQVLLYHEGYTIKGVQKVLRERGARYAAELGRNDAADHGVLESVTNGLHADSEEDSFSPLEALPRLGEFAPLDAEQRGQLQLLLTELAELKAKLKSARAFALP
jgi:DNA-binding transcriptional MerR regulator